VIVYHRSWAGFVGESVAAIVLRGLFCTVLTALAWPAQASRPSLRRLAVRNVAFAAALGAFLSPWAVMSVVVGGVSLAWFLVGAVLPVFILAPLLQRHGHPQPSHGGRQQQRQRRNATPRIGGARLTLRHDHLP
jgi:hypothetical protein